VVGKTLTPGIALQIGRAIGSEALHRCQQTLVVARDGRLSGPSLSEALIEGLRATGVNVIDIGRVPTPLLYFAAYSLEAYSGVMLTGSHNPPDYNGLKIVLGGETLSGEAIQALRRRIERDDLRQGVGGYQARDIIADYTERVAGTVTVAKPLRVVLDCGNGVAGVVAPDLFRAMGCEVETLFGEVDGRFPHHHPDPSQPKNLEDLIEAVRRTGADVGLAFDGDADRLGVVDERGEVIWPDRQMMLYAQEVLVRHPGATIIYDVKCTANLERVILQNGGCPLMGRTGHSLIKAKMKETGALLAGEMSGHIFFKDGWYGFDDALYTGARLLRILSQQSRRPSEVFARLPDAVNTPELQVATAEGEHFKIIERLLAQVPTLAQGRFAGAKITTLDGLRVDFEDRWGLVRPSNTTPVLVLRFEGQTPASLEAIQQDFRELLQAIAPHLKLTF
jgi:phosphomannomutase/phosphoglucomutase